jgi:thioredoxin reductase
VFDVIVVGGGPAGMSAALMLGRCRRRTLLCDRGEPRNRRARGIHGYLTRDGIEPVAFTACGRQELTPYGIEVRPGSVTGATRERDSFRVEFEDGREEYARFLLLATGVVDDLPPIAGLDECYGRSVFHCPYCDGWEVRDSRFAVLGRGASGARFALSLKTWTSQVSLCTNGKTVPRDLRDVLHRNGVNIHTSVIASLEHDDGMLKFVTFQSGAPVACSALFFSSTPRHHADLALKLGCALNRKGMVATGTLSETNVPGVFVAGDASRDAQFAIVAAAEGLKAAVAINRALQRGELLP